MSGTISEVEKLEEVRDDVHLFGGGRGLDGLSLRSENHFILERFILKVSSETVKLTCFG